jgi:hypothetical protein
MRHPCYRRRFRPRSSFIRPRCLRSRAVLVELVLLAILIDPRNDPVPQASLNYLCARKLGDGG